LQGLEVSNLNPSITVPRLKRMLLSFFPDVPCTKETPWAFPSLVRQHLLRQRCTPEKRSFTRPIGLTLVLIGTHHIALLALVYTPTRDRSRNEGGSRFARPSEEPNTVQEFYDLSMPLTP
jgi:hypothetical protein